MSNDQNTWLIYDLKTSNLDVIYKSKELSTINFDSEQKLILGPFNREKLINALFPDSDDMKEEENPSDYWIVKKDNTFKVAQGKKSEIKNLTSTTIHSGPYFDRMTAHEKANVLNFRCGHDEYPIYWILLYNDLEYEIFYGNRYDVQFKIKDLEITKSYGGYTYQQAKDFIVEQLQKYPDRKCKDTSNSYYIKRRLESDFITSLAFAREHNRGTLNNTLLSGPYTKEEADALTNQVIKENIS